MTREVRRKDRVMESEQQMKQVLEQAAVGRLALVTGTGPYVIPVNFLFLDGAIYIHCAQAGRKFEALKADGRACFEVDEAGPQVLSARGCGISQLYRSVLCFGNARFVEDPAEKRGILSRMIEKYVPSSYTVSPMNEENLANTALVKIAVETMTGKAQSLSPAHTVVVNQFHSGSPEEN